MSNNPDRRDHAKPASPRKGGVVRGLIFAAGGGLALAVAGLAAVQAGLVPSWLNGAGGDAERVEDATESKASNTDPGPGEGEAGGAMAFLPPSEDAIPEGPFGEAVVRGREIFTNTGTNAPDHVGNGLSCSNCHLNSGREPLSAPMWAAWVSYPAYRSKNGRINNMEDRVNGCFSYSMNAQNAPAGGPPPAGDPIYRDLEAYFYWLATGAPTNTDLEGAGFGKVEPTELGYDPARGAEVFAENCAVCHGENGQGQTDINGRYVFPPLWGPDSYNWGAGMARIDTAAAFIKNNMPLSQPGSLTDQEAWDVAAYIDSHERPRDPRQTGTVEENRAKNHDDEESYYGQTIDGVLIGVGTPVPGEAAATETGATEEAAPPASGTPQTD